MINFDIILTSWNRKEYLQRTIASILASDAYANCERFIIVDNHSTDEGMETFLEDLCHYQKIFVIRRPQNDGWATAVNDALGMSRAEYVFITNNDVEYDMDFMEKMNDVITSDARIGILGAWRHEAHGTIGDVIHGFQEMSDVPAVGWLLPKRAMEVVGMIPEHGPCMTKGGNGEDSSYVTAMKMSGFKTGVTEEDVGIHITGY